MAAGHDETVFVVGNGHDLVHVLYGFLGQADLFQQRRIAFAVHGLRPLIGAHGQHALQGLQHGGFLARRQQVGQVAHRDAQAGHVRDHGALAHGALRHLAGFGCRLDGRQRRDVPDHRQGAVFRVQREGHAPLHRHLVDGRLARRLQP
ncbi:hypothetical protein G6F68_017934 [Rhizopus microsporus]|nr:hypothetical protein G6F68_017934 [Rhizopus microsporus]